MTFRDQDSRSRLEVQVRGETETRTSLIMFALTISILRFKTFFFIKLALKLGYFCKEMQNFLALGAPYQIPVPLAAAGLRLQTTNCLRWLGLLPQTLKTAPHSEFLATRLVAAHSSCNSFGQIVYLPLQLFATYQFLTN